MTAVDDLIAELQAARAELEDALRSLSPADLERPAVIGEWSVRDLLVHIAGWDRTSREALTCVIAEDDPRFEQYQGTQWDWQEWNSRFLAEREGFTAEAVLAELRSERAALLAFIAPLSDDQLERRARMPWDHVLSVAEVLAVQAHHDREHAAHIRAARQP